MLNLDLDFEDLIQPGHPVEEYQSVYDDLVTFAKSEHPGIDRDLYGDYLELHHIVPRSAKGTDDEQNLVLFTAGEHILAHLLLALIHRGSPGYTYAAWCMVNTGGTGKRWEILEQMNPSWWSWLREDYRALRGKAVVAIDEDGSISGIWSSQVELKASGFSVASVRQVLAGTHERSGGWKWMLLKDADPSDIEVFLTKGSPNANPRKTLTDLVKMEQRRRQPGTIEVVAFTGDGQIQGIYPTIGSVADYGYNPRHLPEVLSGKRKTLGGLKWMKGTDFMKKWPTEYMKFKYGNSK